MGYDIYLNGKGYRIDIPSYRQRDVVDFSPRASTPGGSVIHSDLMLYQPLLQTDWRHGFGFQWYEDAMGYLRSEGNIDTRQAGIACLFTAAVSSDTNDSNKEGGVIHKNKFYSWGSKGVRRFDGETWEDVPYLSSPGKVNALFSNGEYLFASPYGARLRKSLNSGILILQPNDNDGIDTYIDEANPTVNYGTNGSLLIGTDANTKHCKSIIKPTLTGIPVGATVTSVKLKLHKKAGTATLPALKANRILVNSWTEAGATWNVQTGATAWTSAGCSTSGTDFAAATLYSGTPTPDSYGTVVLTLDLTEFASLVSSNNGIIIRGESSTASQRWEFASSSDPNESWRPSLEIEYTLAAEWSDAGVNANSTDYGWFILHGGKIYAGKRATNIVHYSTASDLSDLHGDVTDDTAEIVVGIGSIPVKYAISYAAKLYLARADGLWELGDDNIARRVLDFASSVSDNNFRSMVVHNGYVVFPIQDTLYQWNGSRLSNITPQRLTDTFPYQTYGGFDNLVAAHDFLFCTARTNDETYQEDLLCFDGVGWHKLMNLISDGKGATSMVAYDSVSNCLWIHVDAATQVTYKLQLQSNSSFPYANFPTTGTHSLISSRWDMGFRRVQKSTPSLLIEGSNLSTSVRLEILYSLDGGDWVEWGSATENGFTELTFPGGLHTQEFKYIQIKVNFITGTATETPILEGLTLRFLMRPEVAFGWNVNLPAAGNLTHGEGEDPRSAQKILSDLKEARNSKAPVRFKDLDGLEYYVYLTSISSQAVERQLNQDTPIQGGVEKLVNINLIEAK